MPAMVASTTGQRGAPTWHSPRAPATVMALVVKLLASMVAPAPRPAAQAGALQQWEYGWRLYGAGAGGEVAGQRGGPGAPPCRPRQVHFSTGVEIVGFYGAGAGGEVAGQRGGPGAPPCRPRQVHFSTGVEIVGFYGAGAGGEVAGQRGGPAPRSAAPGRCISGIKQCDNYACLSTKSERLIRALRKALQPNACSWTWRGEPHWVHGASAGSGRGSL